MPRSVTAMDMWKSWLEMSMLAAEAQAVIAMRMMGAAGLWSVTDPENRRMIDEKFEAAQRSMIAASIAAASGKRPDQVTAAAIKPLRKKTRANFRRLAKRGLRS